MASIKMQYVVQSCPTCKKQLLKVAAGSTLIGSPLLPCKKCGTTYRTTLRKEWYAYEPKWLVFIWPLLLPAALFLTGTLMGDAAIGIFAALLGLLIGLCISGADLIRIIRSKKRMRDEAYLQKLLLYRAITPDEYDRFRAECK